MNERPGVSPKLWKGLAIATPIALALWYGLYLAGAAAIQASHALLP